MSKSAKIIFLGSPVYAAEVLKALISSGKNISAVVTSEDKPKGRGLVLSESSVAETAKANNIPVFKIEKVSDPEFLEKISELAPDIAVVVAFGKILPKKFLNIPRQGCINLHTSLLPKYRGASPVQTALLNGDKVTGITIMKLNEKMDEGDIICQEEVWIDEGDNSEILFRKLFETGTRSLIKFLNEYESSDLNQFKASPQDHSKATYAPLIKKEDGLIDFSKSAEEILNKIRAFMQWPGAFTRFNERNLKILKAIKVDQKHNVSLGEIIEIKNGQGITIATENGELLIKEVQPENSKKMSADEFARGYRLKVGDRFSS